MHPGEMLDLDVTDVAHGGVFVARHEGRVVFVADAIPGERVRARLTAAGDRSFWRADTVAVLEASPHRRRHVWPEADVAVPPERRPGGADFGHIELSHQRALKQRVLQDALTRMGGCGLGTVVLPPDGEAPGADGTRWRTRVGLHVDASGTAGPFAARSHRVIPVSGLPLATAAIARAAATLQGERPGRIDLVQPSDGTVRVLRRPHRPHGRHAPRRPARPTADRAPIVELAGARRFTVDAGGFWQVHRAAADTLRRLVGAAVTGLDPDAAHLDLYGGVGLFAAVLADAGGPQTRVVSVEADARATAHAADNLADRPGVRTRTARVDRWLAGLHAGADDGLRRRLRGGVVVLDPPRSGAGADVVAGIAALAPATVVYVACDPVALGRDIRTFRAAGYAASAVTGVDLFPCSHHVEAVAVLAPEGRPGTLRA